MQYVVGDEGGTCTSTSMIATKFDDLNERTFMYRVIHA